MTSAFFDPRPEGFEPTTIGIGIRYSIRAELRADLAYPVIIPQFSGLVKPFL